MRLALLALSLTACGGKDAPLDSGGEAPATVPELPVSTCGGGAYDWLPTGAMGEVLAAEAAESLSLPAATVRALLDAQGLGQFTDRVTHDVQTWRVRYRTQDRGEEAEATGFVVLPAGADVAGEAVPSLLWLHPTMGFSDACAPTALGLEGAAFPILFASMGFAVAAPDYLGMAGWGEPSAELHPYVVAEPTAVASLDGLRAAAKLADAVLDDGAEVARPDPARVVHWGASEGGFAALWTDRYLPGYAPEFTSVAVVAAVPPTDLVALAARAVDGLHDTSFGLAAVLAGEAAWQGAASLDAALVPEVAAALPGEMLESCDDFPSVEGAADVGDLFTGEFIADAAAGALPTDPDAGDLGAFGCLLAESGLRDSAVPHDSEAPVFIVQAEDDDLVWSPPTEADIPALCEQGYVIEHRVCADADHVSGAVDSLPEQLDWIFARLDGDPLDAPCVLAEPEPCAPLTE